MKFYDIFKLEKRGVRMTARKVFSIIGMVLAAYLIGNMFITYLEAGGDSVNL